MKIHTRRFLVVDDEPEVRRAVIRDLERMGYDAVGVGEVDAAMAAIDDGVDAAIIDLALGTESGYSVLRGCEQREPPLPAIVVSGTGDIDDVIQCFRSGAKDYLRKPFHRSELVAAIERLLAGLEDGPERPVDGTAPPVAPPAPAVKRPSAPVAPPMPAETDAPAPPTVSSSAPIARSRFRRPIPTPGRPQTKRPSAPPKPTLIELPKEPPKLPKEPPKERQTVLERFKDALASGAVTLPDLGPMATKIRELLARPTCSTDDVVRLIESDPEACAEVLRVSNTARFRPPHAVETLRNACVRLGNTRVLGIAQEVLIRNAVAVPEGPLRKIADRMWRNTLIVAQGARELALLRRGVDADTVYLAGLLHNVGELVLIRLYAELHETAGDPVDPATVEHQIEKLHEGVGSKVLRSWQMPPLLCRLAGEHHHSRPAPWAKEDRQIRDLIMLSWRTAAELGHAWQEDPPEGPSEELLEAVGISAKKVLHVFARAAQWM